MMLMGHRSRSSGIEILEINETDAAKKSALTTQCFSNKLRRTAANAVHLDASTLSAILLNPSRMVPSSSLLSITNEQTKSNINFNCTYCTNDYSNTNNNNNNNYTVYSNSSSSSRSNDKSKVCHLHMQKNEDENQAYEQNAANFLYLKMQKGQKQHEGEDGEERVKEENNKNNNRNHHGSMSSSRILHAKTKQLQWWWCTCFVVVICLSLPSKTNMQPQDFVSLPKSSKLSPSVSSRLSTSLSQTNSLLFTPILATLTSPPPPPTTTTTIVTFQNITSGTSSASFMQSTAHSTVTKDYLLELQRRQQQSVRQQRQNLKLMTPLRSLHARKRRRRSMLTSHNDESNGTTSRNANLSVNLDDNNNTHHFTNNNNQIIECPSYNENSACPCYKFEDGEYIIRIYSFTSQFI